MIQYIDTSVLVAALTREIATAQALAWLDSRVAGEVAISEWVVTEFSAALSIKVRRGDIDATGQAAALATFSRLVADSLEVLPIADRHFRRAASFADRALLGLRAGDALHLAIAAEANAILATGDRKLATAAIAFGAASELVW